MLPLRLPSAPARALRSSVMSFVIEGVTPHNGWGVFKCTPEELEEVLDSLDLPANSNRPGDDDMLEVWRLASCDGFGGGGGKYRHGAV